MKTEEKQNAVTDMLNRPVEHIDKTVKGDNPVFRYDTREQEKQAERRERRVIAGQPEIDVFSRQKPGDEHYDERRRKRVIHQHFIMGEHIIHRTCVRGCRISDCRADEIEPHHAKDQRRDREDN